ncbi:MAG: hypothetical protein NTV46_07070 [Verrucomicrobia bacterium]|nr:hypothetical protein [Verrucomicrobiota bacterium]
MFEKSDQKFQQALESPEAFAKLLKQLRLGRKIMAIYLVCSLVGAVVMLFVYMHLTRGMPPEAASQLMILPVMLFFFPFNFLIKAYSAHAEIRTLLVFQKLNGFTSS